MPTKLQAPAAPSRVHAVALILCLGLVVARLTTPDVLRDPWNPSPGSVAVPRGPGPSTGLIFDLIATLPALLILARRAVDGTHRLRFFPSHLALAALAAWAVLSPVWSADRFAAVVGSAHLFSAAVLLWSFSQLVRTDAHLRIVTATCLGLLALLAVQAAVYRFVEVPDTIKDFEDHKAQILKEHQWAPDSFAARAFEHKVLAGELVGFFKSANSFAAVTVLLFAASIGIGVGRVLAGDSPAWVAVPIVSTVALIGVLIEAASKTSAATPVLGVGVLFFVRYLVRTRSRPAFYAGVAAVVLALAAVVGHGVYHHHGLFPGHFSNSLDFRWKYWVGSAGMFARHPLVGVGLDNFGAGYLAHRLPEAAEEISDPHNFLVRFATELGGIGLLLVVLWIVRTAWELLPKSRFDRPVDTATGPRFRSLVGVVAVGMFLHVLANVDFTRSGGEIFAVLIKPFLFCLALLAACLVGSAAEMLPLHWPLPRRFPWIYYLLLSPLPLLIKSLVDLSLPQAVAFAVLLLLIPVGCAALQGWPVDRRPGPWIYYGLVTGLGLFLIHNLIDFSWSEAGGLFLFFALTGTAQGVAAGSDSPVDRAGRRPFVAISAVAVVGWLTAAVLLVVPVVTAEQDAADAGEAVRTANPDDRAQARNHFQTAAGLLTAAADAVPYNVDYRFRQAQTRAVTGDSRGAAAAVAAAKKVDPMWIDSYLLDASVQLQSPAPDGAAVAGDYRAAIAISPNDVSLHLQFAAALEQLHRPADAAVEYRAALAADAALPTGEPKRLPPSRIAEITSAIAKN